MKTEVKAKPVYKVRKKASGAKQMFVGCRRLGPELTYVLTPSDKGEDTWWLQANDGMVPSGQYVHGTLNNVIDGNGLEIICQIR